MREKLKVLKNKKIIFCFCILAICVTGILASVEQNNDSKSSGKSNKKNMLENYVSKDNDKEDETWPYDETDMKYEGYAYVFMDDSNSTICSVYKAAIDFAMENEKFDGYTNSSSYWEGVYKAVLRLKDDVYFKKDIVATEYGAMDYYKVSAEVVEEIGQIMWGTSIPEGSNYSEFEIILKKQEGYYYFPKKNSLEYLLVGMEMKDYNSYENTNEVSVSGIVSLDYAQNYGVKEFIFDVEYPNDTRVGFSLSNVSENGYKSKTTTFQNHSSSLSSVSEIVVGSYVVMEEIVLPYVHFLIECDNEREAAWLAIYNVAYAYASGRFNNPDNIVSKTFGVYGTEEIVRVEDREYMFIDKLLIKDLAEVYLEQENLKMKTIPSYLKELFTYDKSLGKYCVEINNDYIKNINGNYAYNSEAGVCQVYGVLGDIDSDDAFKNFSLRIVPCGYGNFNFLIDSIYFN